MLPLPEALATRISSPMAVLAAAGVVAQERLIPDGMYWQMPLILLLERTDTHGRVPVAVGIARAAHSTDGRVAASRSVAKERVEHRRPCYVHRSVLTVERVTAVGRVVVAASGVAKERERSIGRVDVAGVVFKGSHSNGCVVGAGGIQ